MHDGIGAAKILAVGVAVALEQVDDDHTLNLCALTIRRFDVQQGQVVTFP